MKLLTLSLSLLFLFNASALAGIMEDFDSLGGNDVLMDRAQKLQPNKNVTVVQNRVVDRRFRHEFNIGYNNVIGGDAYLQTQNLNRNYYFHINPRWTVGLNYFQAYNQLSREGQFIIDNDRLVPDVDAPKSGYELVGQFAPIYGKINMFDMGVLQFDMYALVSFGNIELTSGETNTYSVGAGLGLWISQHLTTRLQIRQRYYEAQRFGGPVNIETTVAGISFGYML